MIDKEEVMDMKNSLTKKGNALLTVIAIVAILGIAGFFLYQNQNRNPSPNNEAMMADDKMTKDSGEVMMEGEEETMIEGKYVEYTPENYEMYKDKKRILFFYANWCPTCIPANVNFKANADDLPDDVVMVRVNYDDSQTDNSEVALAEKYGVTYQHTFVQIDENGNEVTKWNGSIRMSSVLENIK